MKTAESVIQNARENNEPVLVLRAKDRCAIAAILAYRDACISIGCDINHINGISNILIDFKNYSRNNPDRMKTPD